MVTREVRNLPQSVRDRLSGLARSRGADVQTFFERYAMERVLARVSCSRHRERLVLKGAALWVVWGGPRFRPTRDLDFLGEGSPLPTDVAAQFTEILSVPLAEDGLEFPPEAIRAAPIRRDDPVGGVRVRLDARLGRAVIPVQVDVGFGAAAVPAPVEVAFPTLLGAPPPLVRAYRPETALAEKLEAAVSLGSQNSRIKDFYDLLMIPDSMPFAGATLVDAVGATFGKRGTPWPVSIDVALAPSYFEYGANATSWTSFLAKNQLTTAPGDFAGVGTSIRAFLGPVLEAAAGRCETPGIWAPGGPWRLAARTEQTAG